MLKINRKLSHKGFSLIELMVAVVILAIAILGIFLAFNSGWMGMADARDRTVATNYAQEILEDIKNTLFEKIHNETTSQIGDTKFYRSISLNPNINPNIKEVTAQVTWDNWKDSPKSVEASTLIYSQISSEPISEAVALALYAEPYYNILPESSNTKLTVLVQDKNGNLVTDGEKVILFSVGDILLGYVSPSSITTQNGKATVFFTSLEVFGDVEIVASSSPDLLSDSVTLRITDAAVAIKLEADPATIPTGGQSVITVSLLDASYEIPPEIIDEHLVTLYVKEGPGTITPISVLLNDDDNNDTASIVLTSSGTPGIVTIIASAMDLESGLVNIPILGSAESISITAVPSSIFLGEYSDIIITIKDSAGNTVEDYSGLINLTITSPDSGQGTVASETLNYPTQNTTIFTAVSAGEVNITATSDVEEELSPDTVTVYISEGRKIELTALPNKIMADGNDPSIITAVIKDMDGDIVTDEDYQIVFEILSGNGNLSDIIETTVNGVATTSLTSTSELDVITVIARGMDLTPASVTVQTTYSKSIFLSADNWLYITEQAGISIDVVNSLGDSVAYSGYIDLTLSDYELGSITPETLYYTTQQNALFTPLSTGEVTITANGEGINSDSITIQILGVEETILILADNITVSSDGVYEIITFDISIWGESLEIVQMLITWDSSSLLGQVRAPTTEESNTVYDGPAVNSGVLIDIEPTSLLSGISTIGLYFSGLMNGETIAVIFFDNSVPQIEYGPLEFTIE
jgi:prepilin-type N-terminal cleavage/methylation domain-containing protein